MNKNFFIIFFVLTLSSCQITPPHRLIGFTLNFPLKVLENRLFAEFLHFKKYQDNISDDYNNFLKGRITHINEFKFLIKKLKNTAVSFERQKVMKNKVEEVFILLEKHILKIKYYKSLFNDWEKHKDFVVNSDYIYWKNKFIKKSDKEWQKVCNRSMLFNDYLKKISNSTPFILKNYHIIYKKMSQHIINFSEKRIMLSNSLKFEIKDKIERWQKLSASEKVSNPIYYAKWYEKIIELEDKRDPLNINSFVSNKNYFFNGVNFKKLIFALVKASLINNYQVLITSYRNRTIDFDNIKISLVKYEQKQYSFIIGYYKERMNTYLQKDKYNKNYISLLQNKIVDLQKILIEKNKKVIELKKKNFLLKKKINNLKFILDMQKIQIQTLLDSKKYKLDN